MLKKVLIILIAFLLIGCSNTDENDNRAKELHLKINDLESINTSLDKELKEQEELLIVKDKQLSEKDTEIKKKTNKITLLEDQISFPNIKLWSTYYGYGTSIGEINLYVVPILNSKTIKVNGIMEIISEITDVDGASWLLVKNFENDTFGYVIPEDVKITRRQGAYQENSELSIDGIHLGDNIAVAIDTLGTEFEILNSPEYNFSNFIEYEDDEGKYMSVEYDPVTRYILSISSILPDTKFDNTIFGIGDSVEHLVPFIESKYTYNMREKEIVISLENNQVMNIVYNDNGIIVAISLGNIDDNI